MQFGDVVVYQGVAYREGGHDEWTIDVVSSNPSDLDKGFSEYAPGVYVKRVPRTEIDAAYVVFNKATYHGYEFSIGDERDGHVLLSGSLAFSEWGFKQVEYGVWEKWVPIADVDNIREHRVPF